MVKKPGLQWANFHLMRRTHATLMNEIHNDPISWLLISSDTPWT